MFNLMSNLSKMIIKNHSKSPSVDTSKPIVNGVCTTCKTAVVFKEKKTYTCKCSSSLDTIKDSKRLFSDKQRTFIFLRDNGICQICNASVTLKNFDCDHIVPHSKGGLTAVENGQCTCKSCNRSKGAKSY